MHASSGSAIGKASFLALAAASILLSSCATSSGSAYARAASAESEAARRNARPNQAQPRPQKPDDDDDNVFAFFWSHDERDYEPTGKLLLGGIMSGSSIYIDDELKFGSSIVLPVGSHDVRIRRYGYEDFEARVEIFENSTARLDVSQFPASFAFMAARAEPGSFDPEDPGFLGSCELVIETSAPGRARLYVLDDSGREARSLGEAEFTGRFLRTAWDGRDDSGAVLAPGSYAVVVEGEGETGADRAEIAVRIDSGKLERSGLLHDGVSGSLLAPDARVLESGTIEASAGGQFHLSPAGDFMAGLGTIESGVRIGLPSGGPGLELAASTMAVLWPGDPIADSASATIAIKGGLYGAGDGRASAWYVKATYAGFVSDLSGGARPSWDGATRYAGLSIGAPFEIAFSRSRLFVTPELQISDYYPNWARPSAPFATPGFFAWGYLRAGIEASVGRNITIGFSSALRTTPFASGFGIGLPLPLGAEIRWHSSEAPITITFAASGEVESPESYYFGGGIFASFRL